MKNLLLACLGLLTSLVVNSQRLNADIYAGVANYSGDLQGKRLSFSNAGPALGLGLSYNISQKLALRGAASYFKLSGSDASADVDKTDLSFRNLSFKSTVWEAQLALEYTFLDLEERSISPYVFGGIAAFHFNPYAKDFAGNKVFLRSLGTEGQGLSTYPDKALYKNNQFVIPFGGGFKFALNDRTQIGIELGLRKLFTDYLDDVSGTYADSAVLAAARGPQAAAFAFRGREVNATAAYPLEGQIRGNPKNKDWYYSTGIKLSYNLGSMGNGGGSGRRNGTGCPTNIY
ncbi:MAG: outer membrane beta-barrel protein [Rhizobacter sp.]|nr:outer membrane beta-barrel protein [Ferruginibacter sp.]